MTKWAGLIPTERLEDTLAALRRIGLVFANPSSRRWSYLAPDGTGQAFVDSESAQLQMLKDGHPIQLWLSDQHDLVVKLQQEGLVLSFDGFTQDEQAVLVGQLRDNGIEVELRYREW